jgi:hypothetical protein
LSDLTVLFYGPFNSGKTPSIGEAAEWIDASTSGEKHLRLYSRDPGGPQTIRPHVNNGIIDYVPLHDVNPWALVWATEGKLPGKDGKWIHDEAKNAKVGAWAFEGFSSIGSALLQDLGQRTAAGEAIGGQSNIRFDGNSAIAKTTGADGIKVGGNNQAHYGVAQNQLRDMAFRSFRLPGLVVWTALEERGQDEGSMATVLGPSLVGSKLTGIAPSWFHLTLRLSPVPAEANKPGGNRMYLTTHKDASAPGAIALAGVRYPSTLMEEVSKKEPLPAYVQPASFLKVMDLMKGIEEKATAELAKRIAARRKVVA